MLQCKTHYEVLQVDRTASPSEIKKSYLMLAMRLHPDKNPAPNSDAGTYLSYTNTLFFD